MDAPIDVSGRRVMVGDLVRIFHFTAARRRRKVFMYKLIVRTNADREICQNGDYWYAVDTTEIVTKGIANAWKNLIHPADEFEIIDGPAITKPDKSLVCWWERPKEPQQ